MLSEEAKKKRAEYQREWYKSNKEKRLDYNRQWRSKNKEKVAAQKERYWERKVNKSEEGGEE